MLIGKLYKNKNGKGYSGFLLNPAGADLHLTGGDLLRLGLFKDKDRSDRPCLNLVLYANEPQSDSPDSGEGRPDDDDIPF